MYAVCCSEHCQVLPWTTVPLTQASLHNIKLCGLALPEKKTTDHALFGVSKKIQVRLNSTH